MTARKFALLSVLVCLAGYCWMFGWSDSALHLACPFKQLTGLPCPSCGSTRAAKAFVQGEWQYVLSMNPLGVIVLLTATILAMVSIFDLLSGSEEAYGWYKWVERTVSRRSVAGLLVVLLLINWIWSLEKGI